MPDLPQFLAARAEAWFGRACVVSEAEELAPKLRRVRFAGAALRERGWSAGQEIECRVGPTHFRHYTPLRWDDARGEVDVLFYLHGQGPGSRWAEALSPGSAAHLMGPGGRFRLRPGARRHVLLGDETTIGLFAAMAAAVPAGETVCGAIEGEVPAELLTRLGLPLAALPRARTRGAALSTWLAGQEPGDAAYYLAGHAGSIQRLREALHGEREVPRERVRTKAYWADGRAGL